MFFKNARVCNVFINKISLPEKSGKGMCKLLLQQTSIFSAFCLDVSVTSSLLHCITWRAIVKEIDVMLLQGTILLQIVLEEAFSHQSNTSCSTQTDSYNSDKDHKLKNVYELSLGSKSATLFLLGSPDLPSLAKAFIIGL